ncbi:MAG: ABC transporter substrate-binding protein [Alphaproteobacteria bacterium]|nr:ABC transporter substrate-binding protein [Alphaproteobacteria bacterium]
MKRMTALAMGLALIAGAARAEGEIRIAEQFGISYLPLQMMRHQNLIEEAGKRQGLDIKVTWSQLASGAPMNDALLSGSLDVGSGGVGPLLLIWDRTKGSMNVRAISAINSMPLYLTTRNPAIKSLKDFTAKDKIALPAVKVSVQARTLQMAAEKLLGKFDALDEFTVSMAHPDATAAILSGATEVNAHFSSPPFQYQQLNDPRVTRILNSYEVLGGPTTFNLVWARDDFRTKNPKTYDTFRSALAEAIKRINADRPSAAKIYIDANKSKDDPAFILKMLNDPEIVFTLEPQNTMAYAAFMHKVGALKNKAESWKDYVFPEAHTGGGS